MPYRAFPDELRLAGHGLVLREWTEADLPAMAELFDEPEIARWTPLVTPFDATAARAYYDRAQRNRIEDQRVQLAITTDGGRALGEILLMRSAPGTDAAAIGYSVGAAHRRQGLAARAVRVMTDYAHDGADLPRVVLQIEEGNLGSEAVARSTGYRLLGDPPVAVTDKGRQVLLRTWVHDHR